METSFIIIFPFPIDSIDLCDGICLSNTLYIT